MMTLVFDNSTAYDALQYETLDQFGESYHVVVCKIGYALGPVGNRAPDNAPGWALLTELREAAPLVDEDQYFGEMHRSSVRMESDLSPYKPRCDVIVNASAFAPQGQPTTQFSVRLIVQSPSTPAPLPEAPRGLNPFMPPSEQALAEWRRQTEVARQTRIPGARLIDKSLRVTGERLLQRSGNGSNWALTAPQPFTQLALRHEVAFGGECRINNGDEAASRVPASARLSPQQLAAHPDCAAPHAQQPVAHSACEYNLLGCGYAQDWYLHATQCRQLAAPRIEYPHQPFSASLFEEVAATVAGFGCIGRAWLPRRQLIGSFEAKAHYAEDEYPQLPHDFDFGYWNCAPHDQQCAHLRGDEEFALINLCAPDSPIATINDQMDTQLCFQLPGHVFYLAVGDEEGRIGVKPMLIDTVTIDPEQNRVEVVWRAAISTEANLCDAQLRFAKTPDDMEKLHALLTLQQALGQSDTDALAEAVTAGLAQTSEVPHGA
jgi:hypothetical protein